MEQRLTHKTSIGLLRFWLLAVTLCESFDGLGWEETLRWASKGKSKSQADLPALKSLVVGSLAALNKGRPVCLQPSLNLPGRGGGPGERRPKPARRSVLRSVQAASVTLLGLAAGAGFAAGAIAQLPPLSLGMEGPASPSPAFTPQL